MDQGVVAGVISSEDFFAGVIKSQIHIMMALSQIILFIYFWFCFVF